MPPVKCSVILVVMGVSGCGKSTVGAALAAALDLQFVEGDAFHSAGNVARMAAGLALDDADRAGWLQTLAERVGAARRSGQGLVLSCSALKRSYRDILRQGAPDLQLVHLQGDYERLAVRMDARSGHYMPLSLLASQLSTLELPGPDEAVHSFDLATRPEAVVAAVVARLSSAK